MPISKYELTVLQRLQAAIATETADLQKLASYYDGIQELESLGLAIPPELSQFVVIVNWPRIVADSLEERIDFEGYRMPDEIDRDEELARVWQANDLDEESQLAHLDAIVYGRSFVVIGANEKDPSTPIVSVESPLEMAVEYDPRTRDVAAAAKVYADPNDPTSHFATLYLPDSTVWLVRNPSTEGQWEEDPDFPRDDHGRGFVCVVPIVNRARTSNRHGVSELLDVIGLTDAAARALTLAQLATETLSVPQRAVLGASAGDFVDENGKTLPAWEAYFGAVWALENDKASVTQFSTADLTNFKTIVDHYASMVSSVTGLPLRYFGQNTANPPSAEGIRADEARIVKRAERRQRAWGGAWEEVARLIRFFQDGELDPDLDQLESIWRDPSTPTLAQQADAAVKLVQVGILPIEAAWEVMGYSQGRIKQLKRMRDDQIAATDVLGRQIDAFRAGPPAPAAAPDVQAVPAF